MNSKKGRCRASMNYDNVHEKCPKKPCTRFCTRFCGANMALCGTIKHHGQCDIQAFTALWSVMALYKTGGYASSLSAETKTKDFTKAFKNSIKAPYINRLRCFFYIGAPTRWRLVCRVWQSKFGVSRNLVGINFRHPNVMPNFAVWKTITYRHWHRWCCQPRF